MILIVLIFNLINHAQARPPTELEQQDIQIQKQCAPLLSAGQAIYDKCISDRSKEAEAERQNTEASNPQSPEAKPPLCKATEALNSCVSAHATAAKINNPIAPDVEVEEAIANCRFVCNPDSSKVLREYLSGCGTSAKAQQEQMRSRMNSCGYSSGSTAQEEKPVVEKSSQSGFLDYLPEGLQTGIKKMALRAGVESWVGAKFESMGSFAKESAVDLGNGVEYVKIAERNGNTAYVYRSTIDNTVYDSYESAQMANRRLVQRTVGGGIPALGTPTAIAESFSIDDEFASEPVIDSEGTRRTSLGYGDLDSDPNAKVDYALGEPIKEPAPVKQVASTEEPTNNKTERATGNEATNPSPASPLPPPPLQAAANGAYLQNTLSAPVGAAGSIGGGSGPNFSGSGEVSRSSGSSGFGAGSGGAIAFDGFGRPMRNIDSSSGAEPTRGAGVTPSIANPGGAVVPPTGGIASAAFGSSGRLVASNRGTNGADIPAFRSESFRSDSFYKTNGGSAVPRSRLVKVDPNCRPTKKNRCAMTRVAIQGTGSKQNCDGNPECILKLTGKIKMNKSFGIAANENYATGTKRGVASLTGNPSKEVANKLPDGVWRGYIDVLAHMNNLGAEYLKLDHEGFLSTEE